MSYKGWRNTDDIISRSFVCSYCDSKVGGDRGYRCSVPNRSDAFIYICPQCSAPTFIDRSKNQHPAPSFGNDVENVPQEVLSAYNEARAAFSANAFTASALMCRKILMNVAVDRGAEDNKRFVEYVQWLQDNNFTPPNSEAWVDVIRKKGNEATHEIPSISREDSEELISFCELLLKFVFEFPARSTKYENKAE